MNKYFFNNLIEIKINLFFILNLNKIFNLKDFYFDFLKGIKNIIVKYSYLGYNIILLKKKRKLIANLLL